MVPCQADGGGAEGDLEGGVEGPHVGGRLAWRHLMAQFRQLVEDLAHARAQQHRLLLLQCNRDEAVALGHLDEEQPLPRCADGAGDAAVRVVELKHHGLQPTPGTSPPPMLGSDGFVFSIALRSPPTLTHNTMGRSPS